MIEEPSMPDKTPLVLIQDTDNVVRRVRVAGTEFGVASAVPLPGEGEMVVHMVVNNIALDVEKPPAADAAA